MKSSDLRIKKMENKEFARQLEERTLLLAAKILDLADSFPKSISGKVIANQIARSGTSVGANYREANRARSRADFRNKIKIAEGEASETIYWLDLSVLKKFRNRQEIADVYSEMKKIMVILSRAGSTVGSKRDRK